MREKPYLGELEKLVLLAIIQLGNSANATSIRKHLTDRAGRDLSVGAMYVILERTEAKGFIASKLGAATARTGNRQMKYFSVEGAGELALDESERERASMVEGTVWGLKPERGIA